MPILLPSRSTAPVFYPDSNQKIVRYMDITKFISMLQRQALFFCRVDKLEDKFEGRSAKANYQERIDKQKALRDTGFFTEADVTDEIIMTEVDYITNVFEPKLRALKCVNCWNRETNESAALWKIYSDFNKGLMIESCIRNLENAFEGASEEIQLSDIKYIDMNNDIMPDGNSNFPFIHKHKSYTYENEVRLLHGKEPKDGTWDYDWANEEIEEGVYIKCNLNILITRVVVGPFSPKWYLGLIRDISEKYGLDKPIEQSELS